MSQLPFLFALFICGSFQVLQASNLESDKLSKVFGIIISGLRAEEEYKGKKVIIHPRFIKEVQSENRNVRRVKHFEKEVPDEVTKLLRSQEIILRVGRQMIIEFPRAEVGSCVPTGDQLIVALSEPRELTDNGFAMLVKCRAQISDGNHFLNICQYKSDILDIYSYQYVAFKWRYLLYAAESSM